MDDFPHVLSHVCWKLESVESAQDTLRAAHSTFLACINLKAAAELEPDNELRHEIAVDPPYDAGGLNDTNPAFHQKMVDYVEKMGREYSGNKDFKLLWHRFGLAGGSYFSSAAVLEAFDPDTLTIRDLTDRRAHV